MAPPSRAAAMPFRFLAVREALTPEFRTLEAKLTWALRALLAGLAAYSLVVEPQFTTRPMLFTSALWGLVVSLGFAFIPTRRPRTLKAAEAATLTSFAMHVAGHAFGWYAAWPWYDTLLHLTIPLVSVAILFALSQATGWIWDWREVRPIEVGIYLFCMAMTLAVLWEILEFGMDSLFGTQEQDSLFDTMIDLIADVAGSLVGATAAALATRHGRRNGLHRVSEKPKRPYPMRAPRGASKE